MSNISEFYSDEDRASRFEKENFFQLKRRNQYGYEYFSLDSDDKEIKFENEQIVELLWPAEYLSTDKIIMKNFLNAGERGECVSSKLPGVEVFTHGVLIWVCLDTLGLLVKIY